MEVRVYHNEAQDHFDGFHSKEAELHEVARFEMDPPTDSNDPVEVNRILDGIWHQLNVDQPAQPWAQEYRQNRHRSLGVGDVIRLGDPDDGGLPFPFAVTGMGFEAIPNVTLAYALQRGKKAGALT